MLFGNVAKVSLSHPIIKFIRLKKTKHDDLNNLTSLVFDATVIPMNSGTARLFFILK